MSPSPHYLLRRTLAPGASPVSVAEVKTDLRIEHADEDTKIQGLIDAATAMAGAPNGITGKSLTTETWALSVRGFGSCGRIHLPVTPVQSVVSISYYDADNALQTLLPADFYLYGTEDWSYIEKIAGALPSVFARLDAVTVTFVAGFGGPDDVPANIRQAIRLMASHWYEHPTAAADKQVFEIPMGAEFLLGASRKGWVS